MLDRVDTRLMAREQYVGFWPKIQLILYISFKNSALNHTILGTKT